MNLASPWLPALRVLFRMAIKCRRLLPKKSSKSFGPSNGQPRIEHIYVINLDRHRARLNEIENELRHVRDCLGRALWHLTDRHIAIDATQLAQELKSSEVNPVYTLEDQLFVEPQPLTNSTRIELNSCIEMSRQEIAVARSHIEVWRRVAQGGDEFVLILEDDVWFRSFFTKSLDVAWPEIMAEGDSRSTLDILYLSYEEVKHGAPKTFLSSAVFRPVRGLWHLSGYVLSRNGAKKLLQFLPCRGPIDLWINHQFKFLDVRALKKSVISQRRDVRSSNLYSILPALTKIGAITSERASLFHRYPTARPVFVFGRQGSGLSALAMGISMLGYRCCSDLETLPTVELDMLLSGKNGRMFDAYVNVKILETNVRLLRMKYVNAKFIVACDNFDAKDDDNLSRILSDLEGADVAILSMQLSNKWKAICEHLGCAPPVSAFPEISDLGQRPLLNREPNAVLRHKVPKRDKSPWIANRTQGWEGIYFAPPESHHAFSSNPVEISSGVDLLDVNRWLQRSDTFTDNLALFRPSNILFDSDCGIGLNIKKESLGVREYSAASLTTRNQYLYGRFQVVLKASKVPGVVTGFFLHRDSPRQEIDIEIAGKNSNHLILNVFYNPGGDGAKFDYGYRGTPSHIDLGFDASDSYHTYAIEWHPNEIRWFVDNNLVHRRFEWDPTPIPQLPMALHINFWPSRSRELAGTLVNRKIPATAFIKSVTLQAHRN